MTRLLSLACCLLPGLVASAQWQGGDLSFLPSIEAVDYVYKDAAGSPIEDVPQWMADQGMNLARYRLWNDPERLYYALPGVVQEAKRMQEAGMDILIDFHFSDSWADPGQQVVPQMWQSLSFLQLKEAMTCWVECVMEALAQEGVEVAMVQLGNETNPGMMHPFGSLDDGFGNLAELLQAGHLAVETVSPGTQIAVHYAGISGAQWYFTQLQNAGYTPDILAISNYSKWHERDLEVLADELTTLSTTFNRPTLLAEVAYAWTTDWNDWTDNIWWYGDESDGYAFTPEGQEDYMLALRAEVDALPPGTCLGWCYWAPDWVSAMGSEATNGSAWENAALWDFDGIALPAWSAFAD